MWQEILAYIIIAVTLVWVIWRIFFKKDKGCTCSSGCAGCPYCEICEAEEKFAKASISIKKKASPSEAFPQRRSKQKHFASKSLCLANEKISERHSPAQSFSPQDDTNTLKDES